MPRKSAVAIVDDDISIREALTDLLESYGYESRSFESADHFLSDRHRQDVLCVLLDVNMPGRSGLELQNLLFRETSPPAIIFVTSRHDARTQMIAMRGGAVAFLTKPLDIAQLMNALGAIASEMGA